MFAQLRLIRERVEIKKEREREREILNFYINIVFFFLLEHMEK